MEAFFVGPNGNDPVRTITLFVQDILHLPTPDDLQKAGNWLVEKRRRETLAGQDVFGGSFAPYSPAYALRVGTSHPSLYSHGNRSGEHMLDALQAKVTTDGTTSSLEVGIFGDDALAARARIQNEGGMTRTQLGLGHGGFKTPFGIGRRQTKGKAFATIPARNWLGASDQDLTQMQEIIVESVAARLEKEQAE